MRKVVGWIVGILVMTAVYIALQARELGLVVEGAPYMNSDGQEESGLTSYGIAITCLSLWCGTWAGFFVGTGDLKGGFSDRGWADSKAWLVWSIVMVVFTAMSQLAFHQLHGAIPSWLFFVVDVLAALGVAWSCNQWRKNQIREIEAAETFREEQRKKLTASPP